MKLDGIKVLDLSLFLPGPLLTQMMADHGADVMKLEPANGGEPNRDIGAQREGWSVFFTNTHRNKKSIQLNLKSEAGRAAAHRLVEQVDVVIEAFRPGVAARLGMDYDTLKPLNPGLVYCAISAFGQTGPYVKKPAHDLATEAYAGILSVNRGPDDQPAIPGIANADMLSAMMGLSGVAMALYRRTQTGAGDFIDLAMMDCLMAAMPNNLGPVFAEKRPPIPKDERSWGGNAMYNIYETKDGRHAVLGGAEMHFAAAILTKLGREDLIDACQPPPGPNQDPARDYLRDIFKTKTLAEWTTWFEDVDAAFAPVNDLREACDDPQMRHRQMILEDHRGWEHIGIPIKYECEPGRPVFDFAEIGEHTHDVLADAGLSSTQIDSLND